MTLETKHLILLYFVSVQIGPYESYENYENYEKYENYENYKNYEKYENYKNYENYEIKQKTKNILNLHLHCVFVFFHKITKSYWIAFYFRTNLIIFSNVLPVMTSLPAVADSLVSPASLCLVLHL